MRSIGKLSVLGAVAALSACGAAEPRAGVAAVGAEQCFFTRQVNGFEVIDEETVNIRVSVNDVYQLDLVTPCTGIDWESRVAIESRGGNRICTGNDATLIAARPGGAGGVPQRCQARTIRKLTPEQVASRTRLD